MGSQPAEVPDDLNTLLEQMPVLLDQLNHLYNMFIAGVERRPPVEKRKFVENMVAKIAGAPKTSPQIRFKCGAAIQGAQANFERWDKLVRGLESGAIKRRVGPGRGTGGKTGMG